MASEFDTAPVTYSNQHLSEQERRAGARGRLGFGGDALAYDDDEDRDDEEDELDSVVPARQRLSRHEVKNQLREFLRNFRANHFYVYRDQLLQRYRRGEYKLEVDMDDLLNYGNGDLLDLLMMYPNEYHPLFEVAAKEALMAITHGTSDGASDREKFPDIQVMLRTQKQRPTLMRNVTAGLVNRLIMIQGIIISASRVRQKATTVAVTCKGCKASTNIVMDSAFGGAVLPRRCTNCDARDSMVCSPDRGVYVDQQTLKIQELPECTPTGDMPRTMLMAVSRHLVDVVSPGMRVSVLGVPVGGAD